MASNDSIGKTFIVAASLCVVCSIIVSTAAVQLKPTQEKNKLLDKKKNILQAAGMYDESRSIDELFASVEAKVVDLETGEFDDSIDAATYDQRKAAKNPEMGKILSSGEDIASIKRRANKALIYLVREGEELQQVILPVHGLGLWSQLYGFIALQGDFNTINGLVFYEHGETPGLGGEVDNPNWKALWPGKKVFDDKDELKIEVIKGAVDPNSTSAVHQVDGMAGATITTRGVSNLLTYWLGENGFGPFLQKLKSIKKNERIPANLIDKIPSDDATEKGFDHVDPGLID